MTAFELPTATRLQIVKVTPRKEIHGDDHVQAISLRLSWTTSNDALDKLHPNLRDMLFFDPPEVVAQLQIEGMPPVKKHRRCPIVGMPLKLEREHTGCTLTIDHGIDDSSALELYACTANKFTAEAMEGGSVEITWNMSSNREITPELVGALCALEGDEVTARMLAPVADDSDTIDGSVAAFQADHPDAGGDAGDLFAQQHGNEDDEASDQHAGDFGAGDSEGGETDEAGDAAELEAGMAQSMAAAGLQPRVAARRSRPRLVSGV